MNEEPPHFLLAGHTNQGYYTLSNTLITAQKNKTCHMTSLQVSCPATHVAMLPQPKPLFEPGILIPAAGIRCIWTFGLLGIRCIWTSFEHQKMHRAIFSESFTQPPTIHSLVNSQGRRLYTLQYRNCKVTIHDLKKYFCLSLLPCIVRNMGYTFLSYFF